MADAPLVSVKFHALVNGALGPVSVGQVLIKDSASNDYYVVSTTANRGTRRSEGVAITGFSGSGVGGVQIQQTGTLPQSITQLSTGFASKQLVRVSTTGTLERIATGSVNTSTDDIIGYAETDGRVHLYPGFPIAEIATLAGGGGGAPTSASYVTLGTDATLTSERVLTAGSGITVTDGGAGSTVTVATTAEANTAANVGSGTGTIFRDKTGVTLNLKTLLAGTNITLTNNADDITIAASGGGGGTPGGSNTQFQWNNSAAFGGSSGLVYDSTNNQPQAPNGYVITNGANRMILTGTPTTTRTVTIQDATDTIVGRQTTDALTNKTVNATNNTITDTSTAAGDLLKSNGTKFVRFARGSASQYLRTNAGGTDIEWATITLLTVAGSSSEIQVNSGSSTLAAATNVLAGSGFISIGSTPASAGGLRLNAQNTIQWRNVPNTADLKWIYTNANDDLVFGETIGSQYGGVTINNTSTSKTIIQDNTNYRLVLNASPNAAFFADTASVPATLNRMIYIANSTTAPTSVTGIPSGGGLLYSQAGAGKWQGTSGTITTFGPADPHCSKCGRDFTQEWENVYSHERLMVCVPCMLVALENIGVAVDDFAERRLV